MPKPRQSTVQDIKVVDSETNSLQYGTEDGAVGNHFIGQGQLNIDVEDNKTIDEEIQTEVSEVSEKTILNTSKTVIFVFYYYSLFCM